MFCDDGILDETPFWTVYLLQCLECWCATNYKTLLPFTQYHRQIEDSHWCGKHYCCQPDGRRRIGWEWVWVREKGGRWCSSVLMLHQEVWKSILLMIPGYFFLTTAPPSPPSVLLLHCTAHCPLHTTHCTLHTAHYTLQTTNCTMYTTHSTLYTENRTLHAAHWTQHSKHYTLYSVHCKPTPHKRVYLIE